MHLGCKLVVSACAWPASHMLYWDEKLDRISKDVASQSIWTLSFYIATVCQDRKIESSLRSSGSGKWPSGLERHNVSNAFQKGGSVDIPKWDYHPWDSKKGTKEWIIPGMPKGYSQGISRDSWKGIRHPQGIAKKGFLEAQMLSGHRMDHWLAWQPLLQLSNAFGNY